MSLILDWFSEHAQVAEKIRRFLQLDDRVNLPKPASSSSLGSQGSMPSSESFPESLYAEDNQSTASSDDSFEQIDRAELVVNGNSKDTPEGLDNEEKHWCGKSIEEATKEMRFYFYQCTIYVYYCTMLLLV